MLLGGIYMGTAIIAILLIIFVIVIALVIAASVVTIIGKWKVFEKAGKPGWAAIVPYYNLYVEYELGDFPPLLIFLNIGISIVSFTTGMFNSLAEYYDSFIFISLTFSGILSLASLALSVIQVLVSINIAKKFNKSALYGLGLAFLPFVFYMMLGLDKNAVYTESVK